MAKQAKSNPKKTASKAPTQSYAQSAAGMARRVCEEAPTSDIANDTNMKTTKQVLKTTNKEKRSSLEPPNKKPINDKNYQQKDDASKPMEKSGSYSNVMKAAALNAAAKPQPAPATVQAPERPPMNSAAAPAKADAAVPKPIATSKMTATAKVFQPMERKRMPASISQTEVNNNDAKFSQLGRQNSSSLNNLALTSLDGKQNTISGNTTEKKTALKFPRCANPMMSVKDRVQSEPRDVRISKALAAVLRHGKMDVQIDEFGYAQVDCILATPFFQNLNVSMDDLRRVTDDPIDKVPRFELVQTKERVQNGSQNGFKMRATDGHSIHVKNFDLVQMTIDDTMDMPFAIHGTYWKAWETIRSNGLKRMKGKAYLVFQPGQIGNSSNLSDLVAKFKNNCEVLVYIDLAKAITSGIPFFKSNSNSSNVTVVTPGDLNMKIPPRFFLKAVHISPTTGDQIWIESLGNDDVIDTERSIVGLERSEGAEAQGKVSQPGVFKPRSRQSSASYSQGSEPLQHVKGMPFVMGPGKRSLFPTRSQSNSESLRL